MVDSVSRPSMPANLGFPELWPPTYYHFSLFVPSFAHVASATMFGTTRGVFSRIVLLLGFCVVVHVCSNLFYVGNYSSRRNWRYNPRFADWYRTAVDISYPNLPANLRQRRKISTKE